MTNQFQPEHFARLDESDDELFYVMPRLVKHIDEPACAALARLYAQTLPAGGAILDLMSSCVSHLPDDVAFGRVAGLGLNKVELDANPRLTERVVHNLNQNPSLPFADRAFDGCGLAVSVQYLTRPIEVFADVARVLRPGAPFVVAFSNRMFAEKAVAVWRALGDADHARLIELYLRFAGGFDNLWFEDLSPAPGRSDPLYVVAARCCGDESDRRAGERRGT